ncbi:hypothetical protein CAL12_09715 [Bordetella genomosp. 8]|uniref:ASCH domain-containing protein n=1 Tax=Bordetella genomosp. 8 TaxID=1416806 RepID=A0A1W6YJ57_9BORD|nr:hypothetical protein [Bordetella genomosp. 8]ARP81092.1 hypothetical protein CAL12_09715 [Bordetella genomosp. 8]
MSFSITTEQIKSGTKDVTRRSGWIFLKPGDLIRPVLKAMGLRPGEKIQALRAPIRIVAVRREPLRAMLDDLDYGYDEVRREGYEGHAQYGHPDAWVRMFCASHKGATPDSLITRIEFEYTDIED